MLPIKPACHPVATPQWRPGGRSTLTCTALTSVGQLAGGRGSVATTSQARHKSCRDAWTWYRQAEGRRIGMRNGRLGKVLLRSGLVVAASRHASSLQEAMVTPTPRDRQRDAECARLAARRRRQAASFVRLREKVASAAAAVAQTEEQLADTLELTAQNMPRRADQLLKKAKAARDYAETERATVREYRGE